jgi:hypothetical protein
VENLQEEKKKEKKKRSDTMKSGLGETGRDIRRTAT